MVSLVLVVADEFTVAGVADAACGLDFEVAVTGNGHIQRVAGCFGGPLAVVGGNPDRLSYPRQAVFGGEKHFVKGGVLFLVAGGVGVGEIVGGLFQASLLIDHGFDAFNKSDSILDKHGCTS